MGRKTIILKLVDFYENRVQGGTAIDYDWSEERELRQEGHRETGTNTNYRRVKTKVNGMPAVVTHKCIRSEKRE